MRKKRKIMSSYILYPSIYRWHGASYMDVWMEFRHFIAMDVYIVRKAVFMNSMPNKCYSIFLMSKKDTVMDLISYLCIRYASVRQCQVW